MKNFLLFLFLLLKCSGFCSTLKNNHLQDNAHVFQKTNYQTDTDTLRVFQNDSTVFNKVITFLTRPCSKPQLATFYELIEPKEGVYYFIYNEKKQLLKEGKYTANYTYEGIIYTKAAFYDSKSYNYKKNGKLNFIHYQEEGRNLKTEYFDSKKRIKRIRYLDKKSGDVSKIEIYKRGQLKATRVYKSFSTYDTVKANNY